MDKKRREFCKVTSGFVLGTGILGSQVLTGCVTYVTPQVQDNMLVVNRSDFGDNEFVLVKNPRERIPVYLRQEASGYSAVLLRCTHKRCEVRPSGNSLECPCHGSEFTPAGEVISGPAKENLQQYTVTNDSQFIYIKMM